MESTDHFLLPPAQENQTFVSVSAIPAGFITLPDWCFVAPSDPEARRTVPSLSFLIEHHPPSTTSSAGNEKLHRILFDLGLRSELNKYLPQQQSHLENGRKPYKLGPGVAKSLEDGGLSPKDIDFVFLSHVHYDHHGDPEDFPDSTFIVGPGAVNVLEHGLPGTKGSHQCFEKDLLPKDRTYELPLKGYLSERQSVDWQWAPIGPFDNAIDLFGDSSVYVIDTPGHLPGHINLLCRVSSKKWLYLGGDICHDIRLLTGEKQIGTWKDEEGDTICIHFDKEIAEKSIGKVRDMVKYQNEGGDSIEVEVILAHDEAWYEANKGRLFPDSL